MDLPTYTNIWRIEKRLYKLYDLKLPMPLPLVQIGVFVGIFVPWITLLALVGLPFKAPWHVLWIVPPGVLTWLGTRPVIENKRLTELAVSHGRYLTEPRTWCRLTPIREPADVTVVARVWHQLEPAAQRVAPPLPVVQNAPQSAPAAMSAAVATRATGNVAAKPQTGALPGTKPVQPQTARAMSAAAPPVTATPEQRARQQAAAPPSFGDTIDFSKGAAGADTRARARDTESRPAQARPAASRAERPARFAPPDFSHGPAQPKATPAKPSEPPPAKPDPKPAAQPAAPARSDTPPAAPPAAPVKATPPAAPVIPLVPGSGAAGPARPASGSTAPPKKSNAPWTPPFAAQEGRAGAAREDSAARFSTGSPAKSPDAGVAKPPADRPDRPRRATPGEPRQPTGPARPAAGPPPAPVRSVRSGPASPIPPGGVIPEVRRATPPPAEPEAPSSRDAAGGFRRIFHVGGNGHGEADYEARIQAALQGARRIVVLGCTGGAGQTVTTLMLGHTFAQHRSDKVVAVDGNPGPGALARRTRSETRETLTSLLTHAKQVSTYPTMRRYISQAKSGLEVVAAGKNPVQALDDRDYALAVGTLDRFYAITLFDTAAAVVARVLPHADQIVLVAPASSDAARAVAMTFEWLDGHGYEDLRNRAVAVVNGVSRRSMDDVEQAESVARGRCRALVRIPWDDHLSVDRSPRNELKALRAPTRRAYVALAGVVASGLVAVPDRYQQQEATRP